MHAPNPSQAQWRKSTRSSGNGACVEVARLDGGIGLRDSKNPGAGHLSVSATDFADLMAKVKQGELSR